ncbi:MAG: glycosyltransferase [Elusimicrobiota bacterium]
MNIFLAYNKIPWTTGMYLEKALRKKHFVESFDLGKTPYWTNLYNHLPFFIPKGLPVYVQSVIKKMKKSFDIIVEVDSAGQYHLIGFNKLSIPAILWSLDTHEPDKIKFHTYLKNDFSYVFSCHKNYMCKFGNSSQWLPVACDHEIHRKYELPKIYDVVFVGNTNPMVYPERVTLLKLIGQKFNIQVFPGIFGEDMAKIYSQAKIVFNKSIRGDLNMRVFEALSCGSLLITDRLKLEAGLEELFQDKKHLVLYDNGNDLLEKIDYYLKHETEREEIALTGHREVVLKHTYDHRAEEILRTVKR